MKILYITTGVTNSGGVSKVVSLKANYFVEEYKYDVHIISTNDSTKETFFNFSPKIAFSFISSKYKLFKFLIFFVKINYYLKTYKPDVVIVTDNGFKGIFVPLFVSNVVKCFYEMHATNDNFLFQGKQKNKNYFSSKIVTFFIKKYHKIVLLNSQLKFDLLQDNMQTVIPNPIVISNEKINLDKVISKKVIAVGRIIPEKGYDRLLRIWQKVILKHPDYILEIYGDSINEFELDSLVSELNLNNNVSLFNAVNDIQSKYLESDFLVHPSFYESFSMVILEAMANGLPIVCFDLKSDLIKPEYCLIAKSENDFLENCNTLIENPDLQFQMGENGKKASQEYNIDEIMVKWNNLFFSN